MIVDFDKARRKRGLPERVVRRTTFDEARRRRGLTGLHIQHLPVLNDREFKRRAALFVSKLKQWGTPASIVANGDQVFVMCEMSRLTLQTAALASGFDFYLDRGQGGDLTPVELSIGAQP